ncbi:MAG: hypothetical protein UY63_C0003G0012 [Parcubacteria group bacterium GW2011_GWA2_51_10]|nr:MAG: hypothetical protein UY63_C0003G0012 [Parcubacteria group bacterium GW2011_GWA2_51_10]
MPTHSASELGNRILRAYLIAAIVTVLFITIVTVAADIYLPLKDWLKTVFFHHWLGKGALAGLVFFISAAALSSVSPRRDEDVSSAMRLLSIVSILCALSLIAFFFLEASGLI